MNLPASFVPDVDRPQTNRGASRQRWVTRLVTNRATCLRRVSKLGWSRRFGVVLLRLPRSASGRSSEAWGMSRESAASCGPWLLPGFSTISRFVQPRASNRSAYVQGSVSTSNGSLPTLTPARSAASTMKEPCRASEPMALSTFEEGTGSVLGQETCAVSDSGLDERSSTEALEHLMTRRDGPTRNCRTSHRSLAGLRTERGTGVSLPHQRVQAFLLNFAFRGGHFRDGAGGQAEE